MRLSSSLISMDSWLQTGPEYDCLKILFKEGN